MTVCPECGSDQFCRSGFRPTNEGKKQRYRCKSCRFRFSMPGNNAFKNCPTNRERQLCVILKDAKKLTSTTEIKTVGDLQNESNILSYLLYLKKKGRSEQTLDTVNRRLSQLSRMGLNLFEPDEISSFLSNKQDWSNKTKTIDVSIYNGFLKFNKIAWDPPEYKPVKKGYILPLEEDID
jgi:hypothetical protein